MVEINNTYCSPLTGKDTKNTRDDGLHRVV